MDESVPVNGRVARSKKDERRDDPLINAALNVSSADAAPLIAALENRNRHVRCSRGRTQLSEVDKYQVS